MKNNSTTEDVRRLAFVESLYKQMRQQTQSTMDERDQIVTKASMYLEDGVTASEAVELLIIDGINRQSAESYVQLAETKSGKSGGQCEYSFQFEDIYGELWSSYDINEVITASSDEEAWRPCSA